MAAARTLGRGQRAALVAAYCAATFLAFPHPLGERVVDVGWLFAWLAPIPLLMLVRDASPRRAAWWAFAAGTLAHALVFHWIYVVTVRYGHAPPAVGVIAPLGLGAYAGAFSAAFGAGVAALAARRLASPLAIALLWTALDHARSFLLSGFPWATLGYAQHENAALLGLAALGGVYALSFASALGGAGLLALAAVAALHGVGWLAAPDAGDAGPALRVGVLQGNIEQGVKWSPQWADRTLEIYADLTRQAAARGARLVVWPETAAPGAPELDPELMEKLQGLARETRAALLVGAIGITPRPASPERFQLHDSAFLIAPDGVLRDRYDKSHLVPFGEYLPLRAWLGRFIRAIATGAIGRDATAGGGPRSLVLELPEPLPPRVTVAAPVCYELLFPDLVRRFAADRAQLLLAITNDAWYGRTGAPFQFLAMTAMRSAETGLWTARAANTGVSAFIDGRGRVREQTRIFERSFLVSDVPLRDPGAGLTFYARHGDLFADACWLGLGALAVLAVRRRRGAAR